MHQGMDGTVPSAVHQYVANCMGPEDRGDGVDVEETKRGHGTDTIESEFMMAMIMILYLIFR